MNGARRCVNTEADHTAQEDVTSGHAGEARGDRRDGRLPARLRAVHGDIALALWHRHGAGRDDKPRSLAARQRALGSRRRRGRDRDGLAGALDDRGAAAEQQTDRDE